MKTLRFFTAAVLLSLILPLNSSRGEDPDFKPPGTEEQAGVDEANKQIDVVYKQLMGKLDEEGQNSLKEAQRAWIKWRDDEATLIARVGGAIGGSSMRVDYANAQTKLIKERTEILKGYLKTAESNR